VAAGLITVAAGLITVAHRDGNHAADALATAGRDANDLPDYVHHTLTRTRILAMLTQEMMLTIALARRDEILANDVLLTKLAAANKLEQGFVDVDDANLDPPAPQSASLPATLELLAASNSWDNSRIQYPDYAWDLEVVGQRVHLPPPPTTIYRNPNCKDTQWHFPKQWLAPLAWYWEHALRWPSSDTLSAPILDKYRRGISWFELVFT